MNTVLLIDGNSILNRAFYGIPTLSNKDGIFTNAVVGFFNILLRHLQNNPEEVCVAFDRKAPTHRHLLYENYKAGRHAMPEELKMQFPIVKEILDQLGISHLERDGIEADDIIGILSAKAEKDGKKCIILTGDRDAFQLISETTTVLFSSTQKGTSTELVYDVEALKNKYNLAPDQMIDLKALMGDSSDKIPGISGIGEKTALNLLNQYGTLENVFAHENELKGALKTKIETGHDSAYLSKKLGTILRSCDEDFGSIARKDIKWDELHKILAKYELNKLAAKLTHPIEQEEPRKTTFEKSSAFSISEEEVYVSLNETTLTVFDGNKLSYAPLSDENLRLFENKKIVGYDAKALIKEFEKRSIEVTLTFDIMLALYVLNPSRVLQDKTQTALKELNLKISEDEFTAVFPLLKDKTEKELKDNGAEDLYYTIELPLCRVLARMELIGFRADKEFLKKFGDELQAEQKRSEQEIYTLAGKEFNIASPKQLSDLLFNDLMLPHGKKTKSGYSTDNETLESLQLFHPIAKKIIEYRQAAKMKSTYADGLSSQIEADGRIHTVFMQGLTQTGRISSAEPNLQNIPIRTDRGRELRKAFEAKDGSVLIDADYSQIELRILAHIANDEVMRTAFLNRQDIHTATAVQVFGLPEEMITPDLRRQAKVVNFGIIYGIGDYSLAKDLHISYKQAKQYIQSYMHSYPGIAEYMDHIVAFGKENGYVETLFHRRRYVPELLGNGHIRAFGERVCRNAPIQGTAADIIKLAMVRIDERLKKEGLKTRLILQIHDELILEAPLEEADRAEELLKNEMEQAVQLSVPLPVEINRAKNWYDTK